MQETDNNSNAIRITRKNIQFQSTIRLTIVNSAFRSSSLHSAVQENYEPQTQRGLHSSWTHSNNKRLRMDVKLNWDINVRWTSLGASHLMEETPPVWHRDKPPPPLLLLGLNEMLQTAGRSSLCCSTPPLHNTHRQRDRERSWRLRWGKIWERIWWKDVGVRNKTLKSWFQISFILDIVKKKQLFLSVLIYYIGKNNHK